MSKPINPRSATLIASSVIAVLTLSIVINGDKWPTLIPIFVALGLIGIYVTRSFDGKDNLSPYKWRLVLVCTVTNTILFAVLATIVASKKDSESFTSGLVLMGFLIMPFYYGISALLAQYFIQDK